MGSEMCIRDSGGIGRSAINEELRVADAFGRDQDAFGVHPREDVCLLYTSDAADERSSVDLGGRRIIKKKKHERSHCDQTNRAITRQEYRY